MYTQFSCINASILPYSRNNGFGDTSYWHSP
uniref:Uncharacterized protein n=1 Tax=Myoviridae sp. ctAca11 TaxID=2825043 RepID=A0A8S5Q6Z4_9CAUD|nr:MAG TPA: hypothetical protein [Myoviridae sp. ctAca11]